MLRKCPKNDTGGREKKKKVKRKVTGPSSEQLAQFCPYKATGGGGKQGATSPKPQRLPCLLCHITVLETALTWIRLIHTEQQGHKDTFTCKISTH